MASTHPRVTPQEKNQVENQGFLYTLMNQQEILMHIIGECQELQRILLQMIKLSQDDVVLKNLLGTYVGKSYKN